MASETRNKKIRDLYNPVSNPSGGLGSPAAPAASLFGGLAYRGEKPGAKPLVDVYRGGQTRMPAGYDPYAGGQSQMPADYDPMADQSPKAAPLAPNARSAALGGRAPAANPTAGSSYRGVAIDPNGDVAAQVAAIDGRGKAAAASGAAAGDVPRQWLKPDGSFKTPDEVAADVAASLRGAAGQGDVGKLAMAEFSGAGAGKSAAELEAEARRVGNIRNDIAVGEADPYKVGSKSGIAYTPAELAAIEKAQAGIYDPALDAALAKVTAKREEDAAAAKARAEANAPFTLGKDQVRYDGQGNIIAVGVGDAPAGGGQYVAGQDPTVDAYIYGIRNGTYKASDVPEEYKGLVAQGMAASRPAISQSSVEAISVIDELSGSGNLEDISGWRISDPSSLFPGTAVQPTMNLAKQLKGMLSLENRDQLKGSGAISDFEFRVLGDASSALGIDENGRTNLSPEAFKAELNKLKLKLQVGETTLTDEEIIYLHDGKGYSVEEIQQLGSPQPTFSAAGNASASAGTGNRPQRNYNPGNVKAGGLADALAIGTDDQGHLIFPDEETGFRAMTMDLTAKVNGKSQWLPANPTIRQLGAVYAEDPNWAKKVSQILGVTPDTQTGSIAIPVLAKAIATQEGYYA